MPHIWQINSVALLVIFLLSGLAQATSLDFTSLKLGQYSEQEVKEVTYGIYHAPIEHVSLHWQDENGHAYGSLGRLKKSLERADNPPFFLMNASIYNKSYQPAGLWVEHGTTISSLNTNHGYGNFHLQPNGVFFIKDQRAQIVTTAAYKRLTQQPDYALQSGPMLLIDGHINARFIKDIVSSYKRNAVCTTEDGQLYFIMSIKTQSQWPNLYNFSQAIQSVGCYQALYLDGSISSWYIEGITNTFHWSTFVGIIAVTSK